MARTKTTWPQRLIPREVRLKLKLARESNSFAQVDHAKVLLDEYTWALPLITQLALNADIKKSRDKVQKSLDKLANI